MQTVIYKLAQIDRVKEILAFLKSTDFEIAKIDESVSEKFKKPA